MKGQLQKGSTASVTQSHPTPKLTSQSMAFPPQRAVAIAGQEALQSRLSQSQEECAHIKEQLEALRRNSLSLQDACTRLQTLNTQLQVTEHRQRAITECLKINAQYFFKGDLLCLCSFSDSCLKCWILVLEDVAVPYQEC